MKTQSKVNWESPITIKWQTKNSNLDLSLNTTIILSVSSQNTLSTSKCLKYFKFIHYLQQTYGIVYYLILQMGKLDTEKLNNLL